MSAPADDQARSPSSTLHVEQLIEALRSPPTRLATARRLGPAAGRPRSLAGQRLLVAGNGGSAAEAQHLTAELVGRYVDERPPLSAIALHAETSSLTAIGNDYGAAEAYARQVAAHGRHGDIAAAAVHQRPQRERAGRRRTGPGRWA